MTQHQSALTALIGEVLADPALAHQDVFRRMLQAGLQDVIDAEAAAKIGAARYERSPERTTPAAKRFGLLEHRIPHSPRSRPVRQDYLGGINNATKRA